MGLRRKRGFLVTVSSDVVVVAELSRYSLILAINEELFKNFVLAPAVLRPWQEFNQDLNATQMPDAH